MELGEGYEAILAGVQDTTQQVNGGGVGAILGVQAQVVANEVTRSHVPVAILLHGGILDTKGKI